MNFEIIGETTQPRNVVQRSFQKSMVELRSLNPKQHDVMIRWSKHWKTINYNASFHL